MSAGIVQVLKKKVAAESIFHSPGTNVQCRSWKLLVSVIFTSADTKLATKGSFRLTLPSRINRRLMTVEKKIVEPKWKG